MSTHHILVDFENVPVKSLEKLAGREVRVKVFLGKNNNKLGTDLVMAMQALGDKASYVRLTSTGPNALDFHIACYLGHMLAVEPGARCTVISKDKGFDALIAHLVGEGHAVARCASIDAMPEVKSSAPAKKPRTAAQSAAPAPAAAKPAKPRAEPKAAPARTVPTGRRRRASAGAEPADANLELAIAFLMTRRKSLPAKMKTLVGTLEARFGKEAPAGEAERVCALLIERGYVSETKGKLAFNLPEAA
ncbi:MAG: hypothetical protein JNK75_01100 [Betaproteobacteria bacterium]|nr:hypothetical protein [Betaproteobacteria bacterium]